MVNINWGFSFHYAFCSILVSAHINIFKNLLKTHQKFILHFFFSENVGTNLNKTRS
jgi:hypothetical protein